MKNYEAIKATIEKRVGENLNKCIELNDFLADHPEVATEEFQSSRKIVELLRSEGFEVEYPYCDIATAFKGTYGKGGHAHKVAILTEYDALPEIGHACGHCVSGSISVLSAIALKDLQDELDCDIHIFGTPEEEVDGAKCRMVDAGCFDDYDLAIMIHLYDQNLLYCTLLALSTFQYTFHGKAAHASAAPWEGNNALNGAQLMLHAVDMMRQHVTPDVRMHAVYRNGGDAPNVVPEEASLEIYVRALDRPYLDTLVDWVDKCAEGAALATKTTWDKYPTSHAYDNLKNNAEGLKALQEVYDEMGIEINGNADELFGSSDIGNVSFRCPTFHPTLQLVEQGTPIHTRDFAAGVKTERAYQCIADGAKVIGFDIAKIFTDEDRIAKLKSGMN